MWSSPRSTIFDADLVATPAAVIVLIEHRSSMVDETRLNEKTGTSIHKESIDTTQPN